MRSLCRRTSTVDTAHSPWKSKRRRLQQLGAWRRSVVANPKALLSSQTSESLVRRRTQDKVKKRRREADDKESVVKAQEEQRTETVHVEETETVLVEERRESAPEICSKAAKGSSSSSSNATDSAQRKVSSSPQAIRRKRLPDPSAGILALTACTRRGTPARKVARKDAPLAPSPPANPPPQPRLDPRTEIERICACENAEEILNVDPRQIFDLGEGGINQAFKRIILAIHPDKLDPQLHEMGEKAREILQGARDELKNRAQELCAELPDAPIGVGARWLDSVSGSRKFEVSWNTPEVQNANRPVEKYEVWGPKYFSEAGDPFDWVLLATLPSLQSHFVLVEEAPTQQDVMWAADRIRRQTLPISVNAVNGKGPSEPLTFEVPWAVECPWLQGAPSVVCPRCCQLSQRRGAHSRCGGCGYSVPVENTLVIRCPECQGEVLWSHGGAQLSCSCCFKQFGGVSAQDSFRRSGGIQAQEPWKPGRVPDARKPPPRPSQGTRVPMRPPPQHVPQAKSGRSPMSGPRSWGRAGGGRSGGQW